MSANLKTSGIYALTHNHEVKYIGQAKNIHKRYLQHCSLAQNQKNTKRQTWLRSLLGQGLKPGVIILEETIDLDVREVFWINHYSASGSELKNTAGGGKDIPHWVTKSADKPWAGHHSPVQHLLLMIRDSMQVIQKWGDGDIAHQQEVYDLVLRTVKLCGRDYVNEKLYEKWKDKKYGY